MENVYQKYRRLAGMTQEKAAEYLSVSVDSLKGYEYDKRIPSNDIVSKMCLVYGDMRLAYDHLVNSSTGKIILEPLDEKDLCSSVLGLINEINKIVSSQKRIIEITSDGKISSDEIQDWNEVKNKLRALIKSSYEVLLKRWISIKIKKTKILALQIKNCANLCFLSQITQLHNISLKYFINWYVEVFINIMHKSSIKLTHFTSA